VGKHGRAAEVVQSAESRDKGRLLCSRCSASGVKKRDIIPDQEPKRN